MNKLLPFFQKFIPSMQSFDWGHFIAYFILALTYLWALDDGRPSWKIKAAVIGLCVLYGATDEFHQLFVDGRQSDWKDIRNDGIGAAIAMLLISIKPVYRQYAKLPHSKKC
ncbi:Predicted integral membrane protein [Chlamydia abortus]|nr:Predicted integral membrane protein [Chlamydia abortus]